MEQLIYLGQVLLAFFLAGLVGVDRELARKPAGLRTHMMVGGAATTLVALGNEIVANVDLPPTMVRTDPARIIEAVVTAIAFLGAGTIIQNKRGVEGLTTAASLLFVGAIGIAVGLAQYLLATGVTIILLLNLRWMGRFERWLHARVAESPHPPERLSLPKQAQGEKTPGSPWDHTGWEEN